MDIWHVMIQRNGGIAFILVAGIFMARLLPWLSWVEFDDWPTRTARIERAPLSELLRAYGVEGLGWVRQLHRLCNALAAVATLTIAFAAIGLFQCFVVTIACVVGFLVPVRMLVEVNDFNQESNQRLEPDIGMFVHCTALLLATVTSWLTFAWQTSI